MAKQRSVNLEANKIIFNESDPASSLYIVKSGMVRLFRPQKKGQSELAVIHHGNILGEMGLFKETDNRRTCSAETIAETELVEVSYSYFKKEFEKLNPWFQTIIRTLIDRLLKSNNQINRFENVSHKYISDTEALKLFSVFFLLAKDQESIELERSAVEFYACEILSFSKAKLVDFIGMLERVDFLKIKNDKDDKPNIISIENVALFKKSMLHINNERHVEDDQKIQVTENLQRLLEEVIKKDKAVPYGGESASVNIQKIVENLEKSERCYLSTEDYAEGVKNKLIEEPYLDQKNNLVCRVHLSSVKALLPLLQFNNELKSLNNKK
jgi:CRP/FNR family transcriptional regulator, cyclic AMP receptor protein